MIANIRISFIFIVGWKRRWTRFKKWVAFLEGNTTNLDRIEIISRAVWQAYFWKWSKHEFGFFYEDLFEEYLCQNSTEIRNFGGGYQ